jgi:hypothetical protein
VLGHVKNVPASIGWQPSRAGMKQAFSLSLVTPAATKLVKGGKAANVQFSIAL